MLDRIRTHPAYLAFLEDVRSGRELPGLGLPRSARLAVASLLHRDLSRPVLLVTDRADHALTLFDEMDFWSPGGSRLLFPEPNPIFYEQGAWGALIRRDRLQVLTALSRYHLPGIQAPDVPPLVVAPGRALMTRTLPRRDMVKASRLVKAGQQAQPDGLARTWIGIGYEAVEVVLEPGQFSRRGGILDIWPPAEPQPVRIEFFGDEIDTLRHFDPATQRTIRTLDAALVTPAREVLPASAEGKVELLDLNEFHLPLVHPAVASLLDYLPKNALVLVDDIDMLKSQVEEIEEQAVKVRVENIQEGTLAANFPIPYLSWSELQDSLTGRQVIELGRSTAEEPSALASAFSPAPRFAGRLKTVLEYLHENSLRRDSLFVISRQVSRLHELWDESPKEDLDPRATPELREGTLSEGWILHFPGGSALHLLTDSELFGWERPQPRSRHRAQAEAPEAAYADLQPGDWVVHVDHGIGRFTGLVRRSLEGVEREFLTIQYEDNAQVFVPIHQADRITRYIGPGGAEPSASRLGGAEWPLAKARVEHAVEDVAEELLDLYATRQITPGYAFQPDTPWQQELEASFPYIETPDQVTAIRDVKKDLERSRPMDRLLCGDVGYGKTEVALRAAFKVVMEGRQVALLVPTTVLAQQHFETFTQRLAPFPAVVEMLSRFRTPKEQDDILKRLAAGAVDIVIGTHRLISADVQFKDLGLAIIDEEQRFGVTHKEHLKKLRTEVDVLTLTATPIPRTLYMALTGVRDISSINTPPEERLPIITHVGPYSPRLARQAVLRELERGGQVFFVHNRVQTIPAMYHHLTQLVPEATIGIGHGQMPEQELASVMQHFTRGEIDILLCTSIIESGLDIPNANTLIVDRADTFGLAQLYQLRGRVGRGAQRAYAYFFRHRKRLPTPEGEERLEVIAENTQLGSGYSIAMRDLEMRGAGELLGTRQSGYIASVGFHMYTYLLSQAVRRQRKEQGLPPLSDEAMLPFAEGYIPVSVELPLDIAIPVDYVPDQVMRLSLYRRLAGLTEAREVDAITEEFIDRFGPLPQEVENLLYQIRIRLLAQKAGLASVAVESDQLVLRYPALPEGAPPRQLPPLGPLARPGKNAYWLPYITRLDDWQSILMTTLTDLLDRLPPS